MHYFAEYALFLAKSATIVIAILIVILGIIAFAAKSKEKIKGKLEIKKMNDDYVEMKNILNAEILSNKDYKKYLKSEKKNEKDIEKKIKSQKKIYLLHFCGDIRAAAVKHLRHEVTALLTVATPQDEVVVCIESQGGMVHSYGLAAAQLARIRQRQIPLTAIVDKVAASGGYLMACVANQIIAAPFAIIGSIGVVGQIPNFHRFLEKHNIDFEQITAGEYKRTLTLFGKNTEKGRQKFKEEIEDVHHLFKQYIIEYRPKVDINQVATGEHWYGTEAASLNLVDLLMTSDDYLLNASNSADIYKICYTTKKSLSDKISLAVKTAIGQAWLSWRERAEDINYL